MNKDKYHRMAVTMLIEIFILFSKKEKWIEIPEASKPDAVDENGRVVHPRGDKARSWSLWGAIQRVSPGFTEHDDNSPLVIVMAKRMIAETILLHNFPSSGSTELHDIITGYDECHRVSRGGILNLLEIAIEENKDGGENDKLQ